MSFLAVVLRTSATVAALLAAGASTVAPGNVTVNWAGDASALATA